MDSAHSDCKASSQQKQYFVSPYVFVSILLTEFSRKYVVDGFTKIIDLPIINCIY